MASSTFKGQVRVPFGNVVPELYFYKRDPKDRETYRSEKIQGPRLENYKINMIIRPKFMPIEQHNSLVA